MASFEVPVNHDWECTPSMTKGPCGRRNRDLPISCALDGRDCKRGVVARLGGMEKAGNFQARSMRRDEAGITLSDALVAAAKRKVALHDDRRDAPALRSVAELQVAYRLPAVLSPIGQLREKLALPSCEAGQGDSGSIVRCRLARSNRRCPRILGTLTGRRTSGARIAPG